jgi:NTP pyrophosphatase (non-canonical NTP hydrolase)
MSKKNDKNIFSSMMAAVKKFRDDRNWEQYHTPKNLAMDLVRESSEAVEICLWQTDEELLKDEERKADIAKELADVLHCSLLFSDVLEIDLVRSFWDKLDELDKRYPPDKYTDESTYSYKKKKRLQQEKREMNNS